MLGRSAVRAVRRRGGVAPRFARPNVRFTNVVWDRPRVLSDVVKLPLLQRESGEKISEIWTEYHKDREADAGALLTGNEFREMRGRIDASPMAVFPVFDKEGGNFNFLFAQWQENYCLLTSLEEYRAKQEEAAPLAIVYLFDDLLWEKDLVLCRLEALSKEFPVAHKSFLLDLVMKSYLEQGLYRDVHTFNNNTRNFNYNAFVGKCRDLFRQRNIREYCEPQKSGILMPGDPGYDDALAEARHNKSKEVRLSDVLPTEVNLDALEHYAKQKARR
ncbi:MAG: hypothetical protein MHM6MM_008188 [Cercozoa sp. M6MM]